MSASAATTLFGKIAVHNKLITPEQWEQALTFHSRTGGEVSVEDFLLQQGWVSEKHIEAIKRKLNEHFEKQKASAPKSVAKPPAADAPMPLADDAGRMVAGSAVRPAESHFSDDDGAKTQEMAAQAAPRPEPAPAPAAPEPAAVTGERIPSPVKPLQLDPFAVQIMKEAIKLKASDVHFACGSPPFMRVNGALTFTKHPPLTPDHALKIVLGFMNDQQQQHWLKNKDLDFSFDSKELGRSRVNALEQFRGPDIIFRLIPRGVPTLEELGLPLSIAKFTEWHQGLVLITGPAGSGKTTTAAALVDMINTTRKDHIITVEDPVEFLQPSKNCNVTQRQVPIHTRNFASALKAALREDPDIIMIGEMRDLETVSLAIRAAETGHLVIGTLQTKNAPRTIDRVVDVFPADQQSQIRTMLSESLRGIVSQALIPTADNKGRVVACEIMFITGAISNLIRDSRTFQLHSIMETSRKAGHKLMDDSLMELLSAGRITRDEALKISEYPKKIRAATGG